MTTPTTEPRIRLFETNGGLAWTSTADAAELAAELKAELIARQALADHALPPDPRAWCNAVIDFGDPAAPGAWRRRWAGRVRLDANREVEMRPAGEFLEAILTSPNPIVGSGQ
jgi:hypothetical protein